MRTLTLLGVLFLAKTSAFAAAKTAAAPAAPAAEALPNASELLKEADRARGGLDNGVGWEIDLKSTGEEDSSTVHYVVKALKDDALVEATAPGRNKGETMLFNDKNLWFFKPGIKKPVAISPRQKLMGQAANGDIAATHYSRDYDATILGEETVDGVATWKLELKAKSSNPTYDKIHYWISKKERVGVQAEYFALSGEKFKKAQFVYKNRLKVDDKEYPFVSQMTIEDAVSAEKRTVLNYQTPKTQKLTDSLFQVNNIVR